MLHLCIPAVKPGHLHQNNCAILTHLCSPHTTLQSWHSCALFTQMCSLQTVPTHCGAGLFTWWVLQKAPGRGQASRVLAVEPMSQNVAVMQANLQRHDLTSQVMNADRLCSSCCDTAEQYQWALSLVKVSCTTLSLLAGIGADHVALS